ncbi:MAG: hypothetical protein BroJett014_22090 [Planctomycetota bacterium]|nr:MAG: hypothetical protein BroJett014_22090 [Planctomycetota bacterium]
MREALHNARFSMWIVQDKVPGLGIELIDIISLRRLFLVDEGLSQSASKGIAFAARLMEIDGYCMTTAGVLPLSGDTVLHVLKHIDPRFNPEAKDRLIYLPARELEPEIERVTIAHQRAENAGAYERPARRKTRR